MKIKHVEIRNFRGIKSLSWHVKGDFNCLIGPGDTCKTTILTALDYALSPRSSLIFEDGDFFNQDIDQDITIQVTLGGWDESLEEVKKFFQESNFAQYKCGLGDAGPVPEPQSADDVSVSISLRVNKSLEPKWSVVKGRDEGEDRDRKSIDAGYRAILGLSRIDIFSDFHFTWGRNTLLTRLSADKQVNLNAVLSELAREMRQSNISAHQSVVQCQSVADTIRQEAQKAGVKLAALSPKIDIQRQSMSAGALSLHENNVPLRNKGTGSKKLIGAAMQMKLHGGKNISLIDEIEVGLEPYRIRGLIYKLKNSGQQIFATTHSPVVVRELNIAANEIYVCKRDAAGAVSVEGLGIVPDIQGPVRVNAEAFLGSKIIACEGPTEIGCLRAYDVYRFQQSNAPVWTVATSYFNCGGAGIIKSVCPNLIRLGYQTAVLCDNDAPDQLSTDDVERLRESGAHICQWDAGNSTEHQLFADLPWDHIPRILKLISDTHDTLEHATIIDSIRKDQRIAAQNLAPDPAVWPDSIVLRRVIGDLARDHKWIKRIDYAESAFALALPIVPDASILKTRLNGLWQWIQQNE